MIVGAPTIRVKVLKQDIPQLGRVLRFRGTADVCWPLAFDGAAPLTGGMVP